MVHINRLGAVPKSTPGKITGAESRGDGVRNLGASLEKSGDPGLL